MAVEEVALAQAHGADGVPMVSPLGGDELGALRLAGLGEGLDDHFQPSFHGGGPVVGKEDPVQIRFSSGLGVGDQLFRKTGGGFMSQAEK